MTHTGSPKRVTFDSNTVEITEKSTGQIIEKVIANHSTKAYDFSQFLPVPPPTSLLTHANNTSNICMRDLGISISNISSNSTMIKWLKVFLSSKLPMEYVLVAWKVSIQRRGMKLGSHIELPLYLI